MRNEVGYHQPIGIPLMCLDNDIQAWPVTPSNCSQLLFDNNVDFTHNSPYLHHECACEMVSPWRTRGRGGAGTPGGPGVYVEFLPTHKSPIARFLPTSLVSQGLPSSPFSHGASNRPGAPSPEISTEAQDAIELGCFANAFQAAPDVSWGGRVRPDFPMFFQYLRRTGVCGKPC